MLRCRTFKARSSECKGTPPYDARLPSAKVESVLEHVAERCGVRQTGRVIPSTVARYGRLAGADVKAAHDGATSSACFETYVGRRLVPDLRPGDIVIMDDPACHKMAEVANLIKSAGVELRFLPACRPDLDPIEQLFSKLEGLLRSAAARAVDAVIEAMNEALRAACPDDILGWFGHRGDPTTGSIGTIEKRPHQLASDAGPDFAPGSFRAGSAGEDMIAGLESQVFARFSVSCPCRFERMN